MSFARNSGSSKLWDAGIYLSVDHCDCHACTGVAFGACLIEVVVGKIGLIVGGNRIGRMALEAFGPTSETAARATAETTTP